MVESQGFAIHLKRVYETPEPADGTRVLVERLWPRGVSKEQARIDLWLKDVSPSPALRTWYAHDVSKFPEFSERYQDELRRSPAREALSQLAEMARNGPVTLVFAAKDPQISSAMIVLRTLQSRPAGAE